MMTEDEARQKLCPFKFGREPFGIHCNGADCMAWRWDDTLTDDGTQCVLKPSAHHKRDPLPPSSPLEHRRGHCGAFGKD